MTMKPANVVVTMNPLQGPSLTTFPTDLLGLAQSNSPVQLEAAITSNEMLVEKLYVANPAASSIFSRRPLSAGNGA